MQTLHPLTAHDADQKLAEQIRFAERRNYVRPRKKNKVDLQRAE